jgi:hypothetical protein
MGRPPKPEDEKKTRTLHVRVTEEQFRQLDEIALGRCTPGERVLVADILRELIEDFLKKRERRAKRGG